MRCVKFLPSSGFYYSFLYIDAKKEFDYSWWTMDVEVNEDL